MQSYLPSRRSFERIPSLASPLSLRPLTSPNSYVPSASAVLKAIADAKINEKINEHIKK